MQHYKNKTKKKKTITITSKESKTNIMYQLFIFTWLVVSSFSHPVKLNESEIEAFDGEWKYAFTSHFEFYFIIGEKIKRRIIIQLFVSTVIKL